MADNACKYRVICSVVTFFVTAFVALNGAVYPALGAPLNKGSVLRCEKLLSTSQTSSSLPETLVLIEDLEREILMISSLHPDLDLSEIKRQSEILVDMALAEQPVEIVKSQLNDVIQLILNINSQEDIAVTHTIAFLILEPTLIDQEITYKSNAGNIAHVVFNDEVISDFKKISTESVVRLLRAIEKGFVPPLSGSGVLRLTDVHKNFVEIKTHGKGGGNRLLGCLHGDTLVIKRFYQKRNEGNGGALQAYSYLCN